MTPNGPQEGAQGLSDDLEQHLQANNVPYERGPSWEVAEEALIEQYGEGEIRLVLAWALAHNFWRTRIKGMPLFRNKYQEIRHQALSDGVKPPKQDATARIQRQIDAYRRLLLVAKEDNLLPSGRYGEPAPAYSTEEINELCAQKEKELWNKA